MWKVVLDLSNYATKADLKIITGINTSDFPKKTDLVNLNYDVNELDIDKLKNVPSCFSSLKSKVYKSDIGKLDTTSAELSNVFKVMDLSNVGKYDIVKKTEYDKLVKKVNAIQTPDTSNLVKKTEN